MTEALARECESFTTTVILHDDVIPRVTPQSVRDLLRELLQERESMMENWSKDLEAVIVRAKGN